jgi:hypothetical protein
MAPVRIGRAAFAISLVLLMIAQTVLFVQTIETGSGSIVPSRAPFGSHPLTEGTVLYIHEGGKFVNDSYYIQVPKGSKTVSANMTITPRPSQENNSAYPIDTRFMIGSDIDFEHQSISKTGNVNLGSWGRQTANLTGTTYYNVDTRKTTEPLKIALPADADITMMQMDIQGFQRKDAFVRGEIDGTSDGDRFGYAMINAGNIGVGTGDTVIVSAPDDPVNTGSLYKVSYSNGYVRSLMAKCPVQFSEYGVSLSDKFKISSSVDHIMTGAPTGGTTSQEGAVYLYNVKNTYTTTYEDQIVGEGGGDLFGNSVCVGDVDADSWDEMIIGAPGVDSGAGAVYVLEYDTTTHNFSSKTSLKAIISNPFSEKAFGIRVSCGDYNDDGTDDVSVASLEKVHIYYGSSTFNNLQDIELDPRTDGTLDSFSFMGFIGDVGSSTDTLAIGAPGNGDRTVLLYEASTSPDATVDWTLSGPSIKNFGYSVSNAYDYDADGTPEFAIGAPAEDTGSRVMIYTTGGIESTFTDTRNGAMYGASVVFGLDIRSDTYSDLCSGATFRSGISTYGTGKVVVQEYYDVTDLPINRPTIKVGTNSIWTYALEHLTGKVSTGDISDNVRSLISGLPKEAALATQFNEYVILPLTLTIQSSSSAEGTNLFNITRFIIEYDHHFMLDDLAEKINAYINGIPISPDDTYHVPVRFSSQGGPGGVLIEDFNINFDTPPVFSGYPKKLSLMEDTCADLLDLKQYVSDDFTATDDLSFEIMMTDPEINLTLHEGRYLRADAYNDTSPSHSNDNLTGVFSPLIRIVDNSGLITIVSDIEIEVISINDPPALIKEPDTEWVEDRRWSFTPELIDAEGDKPLFFEAGSMPSGMSLQYDGRTFIWDANNSAVGENHFNLTVSDGKAERIYHYVIEVINVNDAPSFRIVPQSMNEIYTDEVFSFQIVAEDIDPDDSIRYELIEGESAELDPDNGSFVFTPKRFYTDPVLFKVQVVDGSQEMAICTFSVRTLQRLYPPAVTSVPVSVLNDMVAWSYTILVLDRNGDMPSITYNSGPEGMEFDVYRNLLEWTPDIDQTGEHTVSMYINSSGFSIFHNFTLNVQRSVRVWDLIIKTPLDETKVKGTVRIIGTVNVEPGIVRSVQMRIDGKEWSNISLLDDAFAADVDTKDYSDGERRIEVRAFDGYEYSPVEDLTLVLANHEGEIPFWLYILIGLGILFLLCALVFIGFIGYRLMKKRDEDEVKDRKLKELQKSKAEMDAFLSQNVGASGSDSGSLKIQQVDAMDLDDLIKRTGEVKKEAAVVPTMKAGSDKVYNLSEEIQPHDPNIAFVEDAEKKLDP